MLGIVTACRSFIARLPAAAFRSRRSLATRVTRRPAIEILRRGRRFAKLPSALQGRIAQLGTLRPFRSGPYLLRQGEAGRGLFGLVHGRTRHVRPVGEAREVLMHVGGLQARGVLRVGFRMIELLD